MQQEELMILTPRYIRPIKRLRFKETEINKDIKDSNSDPEQVNLINIYRALHFKYTKYTFLSIPHHTYP